MRPATAPINRLLSQYEPVTESGCWLWTGSLLNSGYGLFRMNSSGYRESAHRASYILHKGAIPDGLHVLHRCDVKSCINPAHLYAGTPKQNAEDAIRRHRYLTGQRWIEVGRKLLAGESHPMSKLSEEAVAAIRGSDEPGTVLARRYGISNNNITRIRKKKIWRNVS